MDAEGKYKAKKESELGAGGNLNMPSWASKPKDYWDAADKYERANGTLCRRVNISLPVELSKSDQAKLAAAIAKSISAPTKDGHGLPCHWRIHDKGDGNPHMHILLSERRQMKNQETPKPEVWFGRTKDGVKKDAAIGGSDRKEWLNGIRAMVARESNLALAINSRSERIDHRSLKAQGADRLPLHIGRAALAVEGVRSPAELPEVVTTMKGGEFMAKREANKELRAAEFELRTANKELDQVKATEARKAVALAEVKREWPRFSEKAKEGVRWAEVFQTFRDEGIVKSETSDLVQAAKERNSQLLAERLEREAKEKEAGRKAAEENAKKKTLDPVQAACDNRLVQYIKAHQGDAHGAIKEMAKEREFEPENIRVSVKSWVAANPTEAAKQEIHEEMNLNTGRGRGM